MTGCAIAVEGRRLERRPPAAGVGRRVFRSSTLEVLLLGALYLIGELSRGLARGGEAVAEGHAASIARVERHLHVFGETAVQRATHHVYALFPTAPPRLAGIGIADTVSGATQINLGSGPVSSLYNPYAAVPSMHIGFALLVGVAVWRFGRRPILRAAGLVYPVFVLFVIVATGNHFFVDAAAGAAVAARGCRGHRPGRGRAPSPARPGIPPPARVRDRPGDRVTSGPTACRRSTDCRTLECRPTPLAGPAVPGSLPSMTGRTAHEAFGGGDEFRRSLPSEGERLGQEED